MPVTSKLPTGGGNNNNSAGSLNIFTQTSEPKDKYGIWVKTQNKCKNILYNQKIFNDDGAWSNTKSTPGYVEQNIEYNGKIYAIIDTKLYMYNDNTDTWIAKIKLPGTICSMITYNEKIYMLVDKGSKMDLISLAMSSSLFSK